MAGKPPSETTEPPVLGPRWGVYCRRHRGRWQLVITAGSEDAARRAMINLVAARGGSDWRVRPVPPHPPGRP